MSLFFDIHPACDVSFTTKALPDKNGADTILVSKDLWMQFGQPESDRIALSICPVQLRHTRKQDISFICWAALDEEVCSICSLEIC